MKKEKLNLKNGNKLLKKELHLLHKTTLDELIDDDNKLDDEGNLHIDIEVSTIDDFYNQFSSKAISDDVITYMETQNENCFKGAPLVFDINFKDELPKDEEYLKLISLLSATFKRKAFKNHHSVRICNMVSLLVLFVGIILLSVYIALTATEQTGIITEIFSIVSCFFVWTAADIFFFGKNEYKIKSFLYGRLTLAKYQIKK